MTSLRLAREVRPRLVRAPKRTAQAPPPTVWRNESPRHVGTTAGGHARGPPRQEPLCWSDQLRSHHIAIISRSATRKLSPRHSTTLYDAHKPRLGLGRGKLGKYSGRPGQAQTTRGGGQVSWSEQSKPGHAASPPTRHHHLASMHPDGQRCTTGRASCQAL
jgi:hypothetical protein